MHPTNVGHVPALVALPAAVPAPAVVWLHGLGADALANAAELERLARAGFVAVGIDAAGHGRRRAVDLDDLLDAPPAVTLLGMRALADETVSDLPDVLETIAAWPEVRGGVALAGVSMGGIIVYRALVRGVRVRAAVALLGDPTWPREREDDVAGEIARTPLLSVTAERDENVPPAAARRLHERLATHPRAIHRYVELAGAPHLMGPEDWNRAMDAMVDWLTTRHAG